MQCSEALKFIWIFIITITDFLSLLLLTCELKLQIKVTHLHNSSPDLFHHKNCQKCCSIHGIFSNPLITKFPQNKLNYYKELLPPCSDCLHVLLSCLHFAFCHTTLRLADDNFSKKWHIPTRKTLEVCMMNLDYFYENSVVHAILLLSISERSKTKLVTKFSDITINNFKK